MSTKRCKAEQIVNLLRRLTAKVVPAILGRLPRRENVAVYREYFLALTAAPECARFSYVQLYIVEGEGNGYLSYNRKPKVLAKVIAEIHNELLRTRAAVNEAEQVKIAAQTPRLRTEASRQMGSAICPDGLRPHVRLVLDNHSAHISRETRTFLGTRPNRFEFTFTPTQGSWVNLIESFFGKMARALLRGIRAKSKEELKARIEMYLREANEEPVIFR